MNVDVKDCVFSESRKRKTPPKLNFRDGLVFYRNLANKVLQHKGKEFDVSNKELTDTVKKMIDWLYMLGLYDLNYEKGIILKGKTGRGKTFAFRILAMIVLHEQRHVQQLNERQAIVDNTEMRYTLNLEEINIVNVKQISSEYQDPKTGGAQVIEKYSTMPGLVLDDIGKEQDYSNNFGNKINVVEEIIDRREKAGLITHGTTNLNNLKDMYDDRTVSRMSALFNVLPINHDVDYRL